MGTISKSHSDIISRKQDCLDVRNYLGFEIFQWVVVSAEDVTFDYVINNTMFVGNRKFQVILVRVPNSSIHGDLMFLT